MSVPVVVLAGGAARRMGGGDKPLLLLHGRPILAHVLATLRPGAPAIAISANGDPARFAAFACPVLTDGPFAGQGPLAGLLAGLDWAAGLGAAALLSVPGDTPYIPAGLAAALSPEPSVAASVGRAHHLVGLWPVGARHALRILLQSPGPRRVEAFAMSLGARHVDFPSVPCDPFLNINTPDDLAAAERMGHGRNGEPET